MFCSGVVVNQVVALGMACRCQGGLLLQGHFSEVDTSWSSCRKVRQGHTLAWGHNTDLLMGKLLTF